MNREERELLARRVRKLMDWDEGTADLWLRTENPMLGGVSPDWMLEHDRGMRLRLFIDEAELASKASA
jgi:hypothetical protein